MKTSKKQTVKILGQTVTVGTKLHAKLVAQVKHFNDLAKVNRKTKQEILSMSKQQLSSYLIEITQTDICKDKEYCNFLTKTFLAI